MSTITVVKKGGKTCIASESLIVFGDKKMPEQYSNSSGKIHKWGDSYIGFVGEMQLEMMLLDIISKDKTPPKFETQIEVFQYFHEFQSKLKFDYSFYPTIGEEGEESYSFILIIANVYGVFVVFPSRTVIEIEKFWSCGSGENFALGAMFALYEDENNDAEFIAESAIKAASEFDPNSGGKIISFVI